MIEEIVAKLPEIYQPIYGHPGYSGKASRTCEDRYVHIRRVHDLLRSHLGRNLRVLDLGCAQGFFSLSLGAEGADVTGVDFLGRNIEVCQALANEAGMKGVHFIEAQIDEVITNLRADAYDLVLGLSVFHHLIYDHGIPRVQSLLSRLSDCTGTMLLEFALREEPLYWGPCQPEDPLSLLESVAFVYEIAKHPTHLGEIARPLLVASNRYWTLADNVDTLTHWSTEPHCLAHGTHVKGRRYFFSKSRVLKLYDFANELGHHNRHEFYQEVEFLKAPPIALSTPNLISYEQRESDGWLIQERIPGQMLIDIQREGGQVDSQRILLDVLKQLSILEDHGLYHNDVRTWNVIVRADGSAQLIDFGSISHKAEDCVWPHNIFLSFLAFVHEVSTGATSDFNIMARTINPSRLVEPYREWAMELWHYPADKLTFKGLAKSLSTLQANVNRPVETLEWIWLDAVERLSQDALLRTSSGDLSRHALGGLTYESILQRLGEDARLHESILYKLEEEARHHAERLAVTSELLSQADHKTSSYENSLSWRITAPLRRFHDRFMPLLERTRDRIMHWNRKLRTRM